MLNHFYILFFLSPPKMQNLLSKTIPKPHAHQFFLGCPPMKPISWSPNATQSPIPLIIMYFYLPYVCKFPVKKAPQIKRTPKPKHYKKKKEILV